MQQSDKLKRLDRSLDYPRKIKAVELRRNGGEFLTARRAITDFLSEAWPLVRGLDRGVTAVYQQGGAGNKGGVVAS